MIANALKRAPEAVPVLTVRGVSKTFPGVKALDHVDFTVRSGEVNALLGENGAGKSTLIKLMAGFYVADEGEILIDGRLLPATPSAAHRAGIATIHQDHHLVPHMTVAENIMLGRWPTRYGFVSRRDENDAARRALSLVAPDLSPHTLARRLSPAEGQLIEIARAISEDPHVLIMDEPTTSLSGPEIDRLFQVVKNLKAQGMGIVFVSHWLEEVFKIADRVTVLRDGLLVGSKPLSELNSERVIQMMVGRGVHTVTTAPRELGQTILEVNNLTRLGVLENVSLKVRAGEIVTLAGLVGAGRTELVNCIFGVDNYESGEVLVDGKTLRRNDPTAAIEAGIGLAPEDRRKQALVSNLSVTVNATLAVLDRIAPAGFIVPEKEKAAFEIATGSVAVKMASPNSPISTLSGGNQQKVVLGRWLVRKPHLLILDEPTKGIDVGAKTEISEIIVRLASEGTAVLLVSSEMPEVIALSDRVIVMRSGRVTGELLRQSITPEAIMNLATTG